MSSSPTTYDVFVSYRRDGGADLAQLVRNFLVARGYRVFVDVREMPAGPFPVSIQQMIQDTPDFVPLLTAGALDRFGQPNDWFGYEIQHAFHTSRNIVPLRTSQFSVPDSKTLPEILQRLVVTNHVPYSHEYSDAAITLLCSKFRSMPAADPKQQLVSAAAGVPLNIVVKRDWELTGSHREAAFTLGGIPHTVTVIREDNFFSNEMILKVDGRELWRKNVVFNVGFFSHSFLIDGVPCEFTCNCVGAGWFGGVNVGGRQILKT
jgi:hypothetical protein